MLIAHIFFALLGFCSSYTIYTLDDAHVCNNSIYLEDGPNSAAILKLTSNEYYLLEEKYCTVSFLTPMQHWSGLTGVIEEVDLRKNDNASNVSPNIPCTDYIRVETDMAKSQTQQKPICGTWSMVPGHRYPKFDYMKALVGYCPIGSGLENSKKCHVTKITVTISIAKSKTQKAPSLHKGFTFVVSAYSYPTQNGESECRDGLKACSQPDSIEEKMGFFHCIHDSLWCDDHINCGFVQNSDELYCDVRGRELRTILVTVMAPWVGAFFILLMISSTLIFMRYFRIRNFLREAAQAQDFNSYAESYELSSNLSSAHHMAIQVRVVCNSNHPHYNPRDLLRWQTDLPPSYDALFPQGPPATPSTHQNVTSITATVESGAAVGVNVTTSNSGVTVTPPASSSSLATSQRTETSSTNGPTSIIDLNVVQNTAASSTPEPKVYSKAVKASGKTSLTVTLTQEDVEEVGETLLCSIEAQKENENSTENVNSTK